MQYTVIFVDEKKEDFFLIFDKNKLCAVLRVSVPTNYVLEQK